MSQVLPLKKGKVSFFIEAAEDPTIVTQVKGGGTAAGVGKNIEKLQDKLDDISKTISLTCESIQEKIVASSKAALSKVKELEIEFGIKLSVSGNVIIASGSGEATLKVTAKLVF